MCEVSPVLYLLVQKVPHCHATMLDYHLSIFTSYLPLAAIYSALQKYIASCLGSTGSPHTAHVHCSMNPRSHESALRSTKAPFFSLSHTNYTCEWMLLMQDRKRWALLLNQTYILVNAGFTCALEMQMDQFKAHIWKHLWKSEIFKFSE